MARLTPLEKAVQNRDAFRALAEHHRIIKERFPDLCDEIDSQIEALRAKKEKLCEHFACADEKILHYQARYEQQDRLVKILLQQGKLQTPTVQHDVRTRKIERLLRLRVQLQRLEDDLEHQGITLDI